MEITSRLIKPNDNYTQNYTTALQRSQVEERPENQCNFALKNTQILWEKFASICSDKCFKNLKISCFLGANAD